MLSNIGLLIITIAWVIQFLNTSKKNKKISINFVLMYVFGVAFLVLDGWKNGWNSLTNLNLICGIVAILTYNKIK
jgi:hypothetical protein